MELVSENIYCVYRHIRPDKNQVFYVGIGDIDRPYEKTSRNVYWHNIVKLNPDYIVEILFENLSWLDCLKKEIEFVKLYGRKDLGLGTLCNLTDGGEGNLGWKPSVETRKKQSEAGKRKIVSEETRKKLSIIGKAKTLSEEHKNKIGLANSISKLGIRPTPEALINMSNAQKGRKHSPETLEKMRSKRHTDEQKNKIAKSKYKPIKVINIITGEEHIFSSIMETTMVIGIWAGDVSMYIKNCKKYKKTFVFEYVDKKVV